MARYSGPSSYSPSPESPASGWTEVGEGDSVREMLGAEMEADEGVPSCSHTQGAPMEVTGEVESESLEKIGC